MTYRNSTQLASRLCFMAAQCRKEAHEAHPDVIRAELAARARQLVQAHRLPYSKNPDDVRQAVALIEAAIDCLVDVVTARTMHHHLPKGTP